MTDAETLAYLRNLAIIARADKVMAKEEQSLIDRLVAERGATDLWEDALAAAEGGAKLDLQPLVRLSDRVRCVEDMLQISLCDGKMDNDEKKVLFNAAHAAGITQQQAVSMYEEAKKRCKG